MSLLRFRAVPADNSDKAHPAMPRRTHAAEVYLGKNQSMFAKITLATNGVYHMEVFRENGGLAMFMGDKDRQLVLDTLYYMVGVGEATYEIVN